MRFDERFGTLGPDERFCEFGIVNSDEAVDFVSQFGDIREDPSIEGTVFKLGKPGLNGIEPGSTGRCEVQVESRVGFDPLSNCWSPVSTRVVENEVKVQIRVCGPVDLTKEGKKLSRPVPLGDATEDVAGGNIEGRIETACTVSLVVVGPTLDLSGPHLQQGLRPVERLDLCLLIHRQDHRFVGWIKVQADDILDLLGELGIVADLEALQTMRFQIRGLPHSLDLTLAHASVLGHQAQTPVGRLARNLFNRHRQNLLGLLCRQRPRSPRAGAVLESGDTGACVPAAPAIDRSSRQLRLPGDLLSALAFGEHQDDLRPVDELSRRVSSAQKSFQMQTIGFRDFDLLAGSSHALILSGSPDFWKGTYGAGH